MKIVLASRNRHKIGELQTLLRKYVLDIEILSLDDVGITEDIVEDGKDYCENAFIKARAAASTGYIGVGDDSGLSVRALGGAPGVYSARYAGGHGDTEANNRLLLKNLEGKDDRFAEFVCVICCVMPDNLDKGDFFEGRTGGIIIDEYRGDGGFGYDPLFLYEPMGKTFAQMSPDEKNSVSHRGRAIEKFAESLKNI